MITLGYVAGVYGVAGWVRVFSHTEPRENILGYTPWHLGQPGAWRPCTLAEGRRHGRGVVARIEGCNDRDQARALLGEQIGLPRSALPELDDGEYYWADLQGLSVRTLEGAQLGSVEQLMATGANDVLVVRGDRERLIPLVEGQFVTRIDWSERVIEVDWDPDF